MDYHKSNTYPSLNLLLVEPFGTKLWLHKLTLVHLSRNLLPRELSPMVIYHRVDETIHTGHHAEKDLNILGLQSNATPMNSQKMGSWKDRQKVITEIISCKHTGEDRCEITLSCLLDRLQCSFLNAEVPGVDRGIHALHNCPCKSSKGRKWYHRPRGSLEFDNLPERLVLNMVSKEYHLDYHITYSFP